VKKNIAVVMGGYSSEVNISLESGTTVLEALDRNLYIPYAVHILKSAWICVMADGLKLPIDKHDFSVVIDEQRVTFDAVYNTIHGTPGEDGILQAYLQTVNIPQTSCDFYQSALTFNKRDTLSVLRPYHIPMAQSVFVNKGDVLNDAFAKATLDTLKLPVFVKPNRAGSSYGISKVKTEAELVPAIEKAFIEDDEVLIESFLSGTEVSVGIIPYDGEVKVLPVCEIVPDGEFFDLEAKYSGRSQEIVPARISDKATQEVMEMTERVYRILKLKGICRLDFIFHNEQPHFVEVNTNPGLSKESIIPRMAKTAGINLSDLFQQAIAAVIN